MTTPPQVTIGLALGGGGARGIAHIAMFEALDELGLRPSIIAGASMGAIAGAIYASGVSGSEFRKLLLAAMTDRLSVMRSLMACRVSGFDDLLSLAGNPILLDAKRVAARFLPATVPDLLEDLDPPTLVVATDFYAKAQRVFDRGPLLPALAASMAIPGLFRPVELDERVLIDGGASNPVPFDLLSGRANLIVAIDVNGGPNESDRVGGRMPRPLDALFASAQIMASAIVAEKVARFRPAIVIRPSTLRFRIHDFFKADEILKASEPAKDELKRALDAALTPR